MASLTDTQINQIILDKMHEVKQDGVSFAVAGNTGYGKTTTVNSLFGINMDIDPSVRTTLKINQVEMKITNISAQKSQERDVTLTVYDMPGLSDGENHELYLKWYLSLLPRVDVILWLLRADVRAYTSDIENLSQILIENPELAHKIVIGINQADRIISDLEWNTKINQPSKTQLNELEKVYNQVDELVYKKCKLKSDIIVVFSAKKYWMLENLFSLLIQACAEDKKWLLDGLKLDYYQKFVDQIPEKYRDRFINK